MGACSSSEANGSSSTTARRLQALLGVAGGGVSGGDCEEDSGGVGREAAGELGAKGEENEYMREIFRERNFYHYQSH